MANKSEPGSKPTLHQGADHSSPYPVSRLAPAFNLVELAAEVEQADRMVSGRANAQLALIAQQIRALQAQAREVLSSARQDTQLHRARCNFRRIPGKTYHLYRLDNGELQFSMLSADDWGGKPPHPYLGAYRLENDLSWAPADQAPEETLNAELLQLLALQGD
jgi:hypothetical protein